MGLDGTVTGTWQVGGTPDHIVTGPDGALWWSDPSDRLGRITTAGVITTYPLPPLAWPRDIAAGPDGALWFAAYQRGIGRVTTTGVVTEFPADGGAISLAFGADGDVWFTPGQGAEISGPPGPPYFIGRMTTGGTVTRYPCNCQPYTIAAGPDGAMWFTGIDSTRPQQAVVGRIAPDGVIRLHNVTQSFYGAGDITNGPDGNIWFTEWGNQLGQPGALGRVTPAGVVTEFAVPTTRSAPRGMAAGADGNLWFYEFLAAKVGRSPTDPVADPPTTPVLAATLPGAFGFAGLMGLLGGAALHKSRRRRKDAL